MNIQAYDSAGAVFVQAFREAEKTHEEKNRAWIQDLRAAGIDAAHPDDGWVDRKVNSFQLVYPQFLTGRTGVGSLVALGNHKKWRVVRITKRKTLLLSATFAFFFEEVGSENVA